MIITSAALDDEVLGTSSGDVLTASAWRGGMLVAASLLVTSWSLTWDAKSDQVQQGRAAITVADPDGTLSPWGMADPLGPGGSYLRLAWVSGTTGAMVPLGSWRVRAAKPSEWWRSYGGVALKVFSGGTVALTLEEHITATAALCRIDGDAPVVGASALTELRRLYADIGAIDTTLAPADRTLPTQYAAWPEMRTDATGDLLDMIGAVSRVGGDGSLQVVPSVGVGPVWTIQGGDAGALISCDRELDDVGVYNACTSKSATDDGSAPIVGRASLISGPLAYGGPFGRVPIFHQAIATTQPGVSADAASYLAAKAAAGMADLSVSCLAHPALQVHDIVTLLAPTMSGDQSLNGRVVAKSWSSIDGVPSKRMELAVRVTTETLEQIAERAHRG